MLEETDKRGFREYIGSLDITESTKRNYRTWVNRLDSSIPENLTRIVSFPESEVMRLADTLQPPFHEGHRKDARSMLRHYRQYRDLVAVEESQEGLGSPDTEADGRRRILQSIAVRRGQRRFRDALLKKFGGRCVMTLTNDEATLEAAHIRPYCEKGTTSVENGLLLRADIHVLFDLHLISIDPDTLSIHCHSSLRESPTYRDLHGRVSLLQRLPRRRVDLEGLREHFEASAV